MKSRSHSFFELSASMKHLLILTVSLTLALECPPGENLRKKSKREKFCIGETEVGEKGKHSTLF